MKKFNALLMIISTFLMTTSAFAWNSDVIQTTPTVMHKIYISIPSKRQLHVALRLALGHWDNDNSACITDTSRNLGRERLSDGKSVSVYGTILYQLLGRKNVSCVTLTFNPLEAGIQPITYSTQLTWDKTKQTYTASNPSQYTVILK